jgi:hypothetical protein
MVDNVVKTLFSKKHGIIKEIMPVTGRADIVSTETLIELEVDMGW